WLMNVMYSRRVAPNIGEISYLTPRSAADASQRFKEDYGINTVAPDQFDYNLLIEWKMTPHRKKMVPELVFMKVVGGRELFAHVFIFSDRDFDLAKLDDDESIYNGDYKVQVLPSSNKHFAYVAMFTSVQIEDFFRESGAGLATE